MLKSLKCRSGSSVKMPSYFLIVHLVLISISLVQFACSESTIVSGRCNGSKFLGAIICTNYTQIPTNIPNPEMVRSLEMNEGNRIEILRNGSLGLYKWISLQYLKLQSCKIRVVEPGAFAGGNRLSRIDLNGNVIDILNPDIFSGLLKLEEIILRKNPIKRFTTGKVFPYLPKLSTLYLDNCQLGSLQANVFDNLNYLKILSLSGNHLTQLDWRMFRKTRSLQHLNLRNNPWHCDCKTKFLMGTLKNMSIDTTGHLATCASADKWASDWIGKSWNYVPKKEIMCSPNIDKFIYKISSPQVQRNDNRDNVNLVVATGEDVYFDCEYSGYPKPKITWYKDNQQIKESTRAIKLTPNRPKIEFQDETGAVLQNMEEDERINNYNWKGRLVLRRVEARDRGTYECFVQHKHVFVHKTLYLSVAFSSGDKGVRSEWMWSLVATFCGFIIFPLTVAVVRAVWKRRAYKEQRGDIEDSSICLEDFTTETTCRSTRQFQYTRFT